MPFSTISGRNVPIRLWAPINEVDSDVIAQLKNVASLPWVAHHVAVMPDVHAGRGATVGSVIAMRGAIAPAAVPPSTSTEPESDRPPGPGTELRRSGCGG